MIIKAIGMYMKVLSWYGMIVETLIYFAFESSERPSLNLKTYRIKINPYWSFEFDLLKSNLK